MASIRQNDTQDRLPDFRNLGVHARLLVGVNAIALIAALIGSSNLVQAADRFMASAVFVEPILLASIIVLYLLSGLLGRLSYWTGCALVVAIVAGLCGLFLAGWRQLAGLPGADLWRMVVLGAIAAAGLLGYFRLLARAYSPALAEARLQALQSRIRPHFLFNSMNAVLSLIRRDPRRAERALEDLADLFRALMADARRFVRLADEITLLERYAAIEQLR
ncbi:MAG TPA: histidine kinase, partial [Burkholderiales bacterium]|nr:histidine kinase [Burkholderiales bacterium]